jgi:hypothetical protein
MSVVDAIETNREWAKRQLLAMLDASGLPRKGSYSSAEVCQLFGIEKETYKLLVNGTTFPCRGEYKNPIHRLASFLLVRDKRVPFGSLVDYLAARKTP